MFFKNHHASRQIRARTITSPLLRRALCLLLVAIPLDQVDAAEYSLQQAISQAQANDPWITGSLKRQESLLAMSVQNSTLPDPTVSVSFANLPVDSFDFAQEPMTQFKVGYTQMFPRGSSRSLEQEKFNSLSKAQPFARQDRRATVAVTVAHLWLDIFRSQKSIQLIEHDRGLFEHLVDVAQSSYTTASGRTRQQDLVRAQLELTRLEDRLTQLHQQHDMQLAQLGQWLNDSDVTLNGTSLPAEQIDLSLDPQYQILVGLNDQTGYLTQLAQLLHTHPKVQSIEQRIKASELSVRLSEQTYKPQWGINASYGYRDDDPLGRERSDFFSFGVSFDLPLFTGNRQDKQVQAATADKEEIKTERALLLRQLKSGYESTHAQYQRLLQRLELFNTRLLREMNEQAEAALTAYTNDDGDFAEVVRARIAELNARIEALNIKIDILKTKAQLNYFFSTTSTEQPEQEGTL